MIKIKNVQGILHPLHIFYFREILTPQARFELATDRLTADSSTTELLRNKVGLNGLEPSTSRLSGVRSNQLSYRPI